MAWCRRLKQDPRITILIFLSSFVLAGQFYLGFFQRWDSIIVAVSVAIISEMVLVRWFRHKWMFPLSAIITGLGISLLLSSHKLWPYAMTAGLAIILKHLIQYKGKHIFNPNNLAMVIMLIALPQYAVSTPKQWTNGFDVMVFILILGCIAAFQAKRLDTVISFVMGFIGFAWLRYIFFDEPILFALGPILGASFQLFTFFMITDPKTTPSSVKARIVIGIVIALFDAIMRVNDVTNSLFYSSFLAALFIGVPIRINLIKFR
jgi:Na+-translocating ferredoxin:NAD+ oxidoreductase RnfD subunit